ncbi:hypothetical protein [Nonomuraea sp. NEAU-A123]|uniref:hypothetical protein n=1 Tax=Nonomuraea sp. NEAU-A123 TaxID=2839649 RepID=UPI001BE4BAE6|nr:hypothetical protein [Nonomuraea sp. NEAU-A123]MBT2230446.1 hypothetical protein [Nonomuraea sp. NEAU-A123]
MSGDGYRVLLQARSWSQHLRKKSFTWDQIADVLALTHQVSPLRLYRLAHGRTAADVVAMVNDADPAGTAALRESRLYDFESWPEAGRRPPVRLLTVLAKIYQTAARNLARAEDLVAYGAADRELIDGADFRDLDANRASGARVTMEVNAAARPADTLLLDASACVQLLRATGVEETDVKRRELLFELALVLGGSRALDLLRVLTSEEEERLAGVLRSTGRVDEATVRTFEKLTLHVRRADDVSGPATLLPVVNGQRAAVGRLLARESMPPSLRDRLLDTYAQLSQLAGYLAYDLRDYAAAEQLLHDGLRAALDHGDPTLVGYVHYWLGRMAADQDRTAAVFDHAFAVQSWAARSPSKLLAPLHESLFSLAHAAEGDAAASARAHESALASAGASKDNEPAFLYWITPAVVESRRTALLVRLNRPGDVIRAAEQYLAGHGAGFKKGRGLVLARYARGLTQAREIPEAAAKLTEAAVITRQHSSARLTDEIAQARARLEPWVNTAYVRRLDETLRSCGLTSACPAGGA